MSRVSRPRRTSRAGALLALALVPALLVLPGAAPTVAADGRPAVIGRMVIGHSVKHRAITAYHLGERGHKKVVLIAVMHGNEPAPRRILMDLVDGAPVHDLNLWVVPVYNPDGLARHTRKNAHGVDLNRNFPSHWVDLDGNYESGPSAGSEPETRALMAFFDEVRPRRVVSFHQPLHGVDVSTARSRPFAIRLARYLDLPRRSLTCGGVCQGTFTEWYMARHGGQAVTVEYAHHPSRHRMTVTAPSRLLRVVGAHAG